LPTRLSPRSCSKLASELPNDAGPGTVLEFDGTPDSVARNPFALTVVSDPSKISGWPRRTGRQRQELGWPAALLLVPDLHLGDQGGRPAYRIRSQHTRHVPALSGLPGWRPVFCAGSGLTTCMKGRSRVPELFGDPAHGGVDARGGGDLGRGRTNLWRRFPGPRMPSASSLMSAGFLESTTNKVSVPGGSSISKQACLGRPDDLARVDPVCSDPARPSWGRAESSRRSTASPVRTDTVERFRLQVEDHAIALTENSAPGSAGWAAASGTHQPQV